MLARFLLYNGRLFIIYTRWWLRKSWGKKFGTVWNSWEITYLGLANNVYRSTTLPHPPFSIVKLVQVRCVISKKKKKKKESNTTNDKNNGKNGGCGRIVEW